MQTRLTKVLLFCAAIPVITLTYPRKTRATTAEGYKSTLLAVGRFAGINESNAVLQDLGADGNEQLWLSHPEMNEISDVYVQSNVWAPGGSTGWHSHPGRSLIIVKAGTVTNYEGHDPDCKPHVYKAGMGFVDLGGEHVHILRNEGTVEAQTIAVQIIPAGASRRVDVTNPGNCHF